MKDCKYFDIIDSIYGLYYCAYDNSECMCMSACENYVKEDMSDSE